MSDTPGGNLFDAIEPHRHLPDETRAALWAACERVRQNPEEFSDAAAWLDRDYSEAAVCERHLKESECQCRRNLLDVIQGLDRCDTFPRRMALRAGRPEVEAPRRLALLQRFYSVPELAHIPSAFIIDLSEHPEKVRNWVVQLTIQTALNRGRWLHGDHCVIPPSADAAKAQNMVRIDEGNVEIAWRSEDEQNRQRIRHIKNERRERDERIRRQSKDRMGRFLEAVRDAVEGDIPAVNRVECSRRLVMLAAMIASPEPLSLSAEFGDMPWESKGNILGIGGPYLPGREELFEGHVSMNPAQWSIAGSLADGLGKLVARAVAVLGQAELAPIEDGDVAVRLYPPFFVIEPQTTFADAWEKFCCDVLNLHEKTTAIYQRKPPEGGVDLYWRDKRYAYQCKSVDDETGRFNLTKALESVKAALETRKTLPWEKYFLCSNVAITGKQEGKLREVLPEIELLTPSFWMPRCLEQSEHLKGRFKRLVDIGARKELAGVSMQRR